MNPEIFISVSDSVYGERFCDKIKTYFNEGVEVKDSDVFLAQCDTTAGFLSHCFMRLNHIKLRPTYQKVLLEVDSLKTLKNLTRIPQAHKNRIRKAKNMTFIYPNGQAIRLVNDKWHLSFLKYHQMMYSTSANLTQNAFDEKWAKTQADVIVVDSRGFKENTPSRIYTINQHRIQRKR